MRRLTVVNDAMSRCSYLTGVRYPRAECRRRLLQYGLVGALANGFSQIGDETPWSTSTTPDTWAADLYVLIWSH